MFTILFLNQKGGVGKTTLADELAFALERRGSTAPSILLSDGFRSLPERGFSTDNLVPKDRHQTTVLQPAKRRLFAISQNKKRRRHRFSFVFFERRLFDFGLQDKSLRVAFDNKRERNPKTQS